MLGAASDAELMMTALNMYANWIETRDPVMSASDARNCGQGNKILVRTSYQLELVKRLRKLAAAQFGG